MKRSLSVFVLSALLAVPVTAATQVQPLDPQVPAAGQATEDGVGAWFVELSGKPKASGGNAASLAQEKKAFRDAARDVGVQLRERFVYDSLFNGFSVVVDGPGLAKLAKLPGVKNIYPVVEVERPQVVEDGTGDQLDMSTSLGMVQGDVAQNHLGLTGQGVLVAVMDTGIDVDHPDFGGCFGPGCRVALGWDFVGDAYNNDATSASFNPVAVPDAVPDDCNGHGTHVAGIIGANGAVRGVAPGVTFAAYRVFGCQGSTNSDIMVAAMERAYADGAKILNISIGSSYQWPAYPTAQAADRLVEKGVVVVTSAGNSGANGTWAVSAPGIGEKVIATANIQNTHVKFPVFSVSPDNLAVAYVQATGSSLAPLSGTATLARTGTATSTADACNTNPPPPGSLLGQVALVRRGTCGFAEKAVNAQNAGAAGVIIYNNVAGAIQNITVVNPVAITIPVVSISAPDGVTLSNRLASGPVTLTWTDQAIATPNSLANLVSTSSSHGLSPTLSLKPDLAAPGGSIRSTYPLEQGGYANLSGTSMASPHVAGAVALLLEAQPNTPTQEILPILQNYSEPRIWNGNPGLGFLEMVHLQGAGILQIADAIQGTVRIAPGKLSLGESENGPATRTLTVRNTGAAAVTYTASHQPALASRGTFLPLSYYNAPAAVTWGASTLTVPAGGTATLNVTIAPPDSVLPDRSLYGGYLVLTPQDGGRELRVPYAGFKGDYQSIQALTPTTNGFPWLAKLQNNSYSNQPNGATFTLQNGDLPYFLIHFDHQAQRLEMEIQNAANGQPIHPVFHNLHEEDYLPRNSSATSFFSFAWDGTRLHSNGNKLKTKEVPDGQYVVVVKALKALGDASNPAHWETWTSPVITIDRP